MCECNQVRGGRPVKISIDINCSPEEARRFLGLPDVTVLNEAMMGEVKARMADAMKVMDPETFMKTWLPTGMAGAEQLKSFWSQFTQRPGEKGKT